MATSEVPRSGSGWGASTRWTNAPVAGASTRFAGGTATFALDVSAGLRSLTYGPTGSTAGGTVGT